MSLKEQLIGRGTIAGLTAISYLPEPLLLAIAKDGAPLVHYCNQRARALDAQTLHACMNFEIRLRQQVAHSRVGRAKCLSITCASTLRARARRAMRGRSLQRASN